MFSCFYWRKDTETRWIYRWLFAEGTHYVKSSYLWDISHGHSWPPSKIRWDKSCCDLANLKVHFIVIQWWGEKKNSLTTKPKHVSKHWSKLFPQSLFAGIILEFTQQARRRCERNASERTHLLICLPFWRTIFKIHEHKIRLMPHKPPWSDRSDSSAKKQQVWKKCIRLGSFVDVVYNLR